MKHTARKLTAVAAVGVVTVLSGAGNASATGATAARYTSSVRGGNQLSGTVYDLMADGLCARVYSRGKSLGGAIVTNWSHVATACGAGATKHYSETYSFMIVSVQQRICIGAPGGKNLACHTGRWVG